MKIFEFEQYSPEWWSTRCALPSASRAGEILTPTGRASASADKYLAELVADSLGYQEIDDDLQSYWMARGSILEAEARDYFELQTGRSVRQVGLLTNDEGTACCSPDGLIDDETGWEVKCPMPKNHIMYVLAGELPKIYLPQVHFSMAVSGLKKWYFGSYHPEIEPFGIMVEWDDYTDKMAAALAAFIDKLQKAKELF